MIDFQPVLTSPEEIDDLESALNELTLAALDYAPRAKIADTIRIWLKDVDPDDSETSPETLADALTLATELAITYPSASGTTAIDRLLRQRRDLPPAVCTAFAKQQFRLLRMAAEEAPGIIRLDDLASGEKLRLFNDGMPFLAGLPLAARLNPLPKGDGYLCCGLIVPLDDSALAVAMGFVRAGGKGLHAPHRCAEALYRHIVRNGGLDIPGINRPLADDDELEPDFPYDPEGNDLDALAFAWADLPEASDPPAADLDDARQLSSIDYLVQAVSFSAHARYVNRPRLSEAYARLAIIQMETLLLRVAMGVQPDMRPLDRAAAAIDALVAAGHMPSVVRDLFESLRLRVREPTANKQRTQSGGDLDRLIQRIQALRAKTVEQGCTEAEALAAAAKVAELLDRYGLSMGEIDLQQQSCEGIGIDTSRKRTGAIDLCIPTIAAFFDCRVWGETTPSGTLRYVFFGLPADVEAAHYLYDLIEITFATETETFKRSDVYTSLLSGQRRSGTTSFQTGLAHGIIGKLARLRTEREASLRNANGRDLVVIKDSVVDEELAKLGMTFHSRTRKGKRSVISDAYTAGQEAGERFEFRPGLTEAP